MINREAPGDEAAAGSANDDGCPEMKRVHESHQVLREIAGMVAPCWTACVAMAPLRQGEGVDRRGQIGEYELEGSPGVSDGVQEQDRNTRRVSLLDVGEVHPAGKLYRPDDALVFYSSQASMLVWRTIMPSRNSSVVEPRTLTPSGYSHASL